MLTGTAPLLIFTIFRDGETWKAGEGGVVGEKITLKEWQALPMWKKYLYHGPVPIPIYLSEEVVQVAPDDADQTIKADYATVGGLTFQGTISNTVTINLRAAKDNIIIMSVLSAIKQISQYIASQRYSVTAYYDSTFVLDGLLVGISNSTVQNTNQKAIALVLGENGAGDEATGNDKPSLTNLVGGTEFLPGLGV